MKNWLELVLGSPVLDMHTTPRWVICGARGVAGALP